MSAPMTLTLDLNDPRASKILRAMAKVLEEQGGGVEQDAPAGQAPAPSPNGKKKDEKRSGAGSRPQSVVPPDPDELPKGEVRSLMDHRLTLTAAGQGHVSKS